MKLIKLFIFIWMINIILISNTYALEEHFFPESIRNRMQSDLVDFLKTIPQNEGQKKRVDRVLKNPNYKDILLFIDPSFSPKAIETLSNNDELFSLIEVLDILSYNLGLKDSFSNWYLSHVVSLVENKPSLYLVSFLRFSQFSDGAYSEWFADPLKKIILTYPKEFSIGLEETNSWEKICYILKTGDFRQVINTLRCDETKNFNNTQKLLTCLRESIGHERNSGGINQTG